ncbi:hypothetical protein WG954_05900 [Lacibacter sp. H375]|uniref:hypothetical protein n=1 Tax=Lacibacter sp. H375 TaxID=3133424 RepID=UPI0030C079E2
MNYESFKRLLQDCMDASSRCSSACLEQENHFLTRCAKLNQSCVIVSKVAMKAMVCRTELLAQVYRLCIEIYTTCAEECEKFIHLEHCKQSADACRKSIAECRSYLATVTEDRRTPITSTK